MSSSPYRQRFTPGAGGLPPLVLPSRGAALGSAQPADARSGSHVLYVNVGAASHVYPGLPLVRELVRRGVRVTYAVGEQVGGIVAATGARLLACTSVLPTGDSAGLRWPTDPIETTNLFLDETEHVLPQIVAGLDGDRPDLVLFDSAALAGQVAASRWGVPAVEVAASVVPSAATESSVDAVVKAFAALRGGAECLERRLEFLAREGVGLDLARVVAGAERTLMLIPRTLQQETPSSAREFVGPLFDEQRLSGGQWAPPPGNERPVVLVAFGTMFSDQLEIYRACLEGLGDGSCHLVMAVGRQVDPAVFGETPPFVEIHQTVPQLAVLRHARAFVTHGGMGSVIEALWFGVPMVVVPQAADHFGNAARVEQLGVGQRVSTERATADALKRAVKRVRSEIGIRIRIAEVAREVRSGGSPAKAADAVEALVPAP